MVKRVVTLAKSNAETNPETLFYPPIKKHRGKSRDLPMVDLELRDSLAVYTYSRLDKMENYAPPLHFHYLFLKKGRPYSPNTLQEHM